MRLDRAAERYFRGGAGEVAPRKIMFLDALIELVSEIRILPYPLGLSVAFRFLTVAP